MGGLTSGLFQKKTNSRETNVSSPLLSLVRPSMQQPQVWSNTFYAGQRPWTAEIEVPYEGQRPKYNLPQNPQQLAVQQAPEERSLSGSSPMRTKNTKELKERWALQAPLGVDTIPTDIAANTTETKSPSSRDTTIVQVKMPEPDSCKRMFCAHNLACDARQGFFASNHPLLKTATYDDQ